MKTRPFALGLLAMSATAFVPHASAGDARFMAALDKLDPKTRLEQICDFEAMRRLSQNGPRVERAKSDVLIPPQHLGNTLVARGGAYRASGKWIQLAFTCKATPDHKTVLDFTYKSGAVIPPAKWQDYGLWK